MANLNDLFPSKWLKAFDLQGSEPVVKIARVELAAMGNTRELKPVVFFQGKTKGLRLNKTMALFIAALAGSEETDRWIGLTVQLYGTTATFGDQTYPVVRVKAPSRQPVLMKGGGTR